MRHKNQKEGTGTKKNNTGHKSQRFGQLSQIQQFLGDAVKEKKPARLASDGPIRLGLNCRETNLGQR